MRRAPERRDPWTIALLFIYAAGIVGALAWGWSLEKPYPCEGRHHCGTEAMR